MRDTVHLHGRYLVASYPNRGLAITSGDGVFLKDADGALYLDFMTNYGVSIFGHGHPLLSRALFNQIGRLSTLHGSFANDVRTEAAKALVLRCGGGLSRVSFSNSGAEANEAAIKFAALATGKKSFVACNGGYHGKTLGALSATDGPKYRQPFEPLLWDFQFVPFNDLSALDAAVDRDTAAFIVEPIQGENGVLPAASGYLRQAAVICRSRGALMIIDEIQTGSGRTGRFLASQEEGLSYDIVTMGKGLAAGLPIGVTIVSSEVADRIPRGGHTSTLGGNPLAAAGILATLELLDDHCLIHVASMGELLVQSLRGTADPTIREVRGRGLMVGVEVAVPRDAVLKALQRNRLLAIPAGETVVRFLPPYIIDRAHVDSAKEKLILSLAGAAFQGKA